MIRLVQKLAVPHQSMTSLTLPWEQRNKCRMRVTLDDGRPAGVFLNRGTVLHANDLLISEDGMVVKVQAAMETVSTVKSNDPLLLARACYHLGNRHAALQITKEWIRYLYDHVLDEMIRGLGLEICIETAPFEPEAGAYGSTGHHHHGN